MSGEPSYLELGVPDVAKATTFYAGLLGWEVTPQGEHGGYVRTPTLDIGLHDGDEERHVEVFFAVPDLDAAIATLTELGGRTVSPVNDSPGFGRWVECRDDQQVRFGLREVSEPPR